jgi:hypothetical protein
MKEPKFQNPLKRFSKMPSSPKLHPTTFLYRATPDVRYGIRQTDKKNYLFLMATRNEIPDAAHALEDVRRS